MTTAAYLNLVADSTSIAKADATLDKLAVTGAKTEAAVTRSTANMSRGMASVGGASKASSNNVKMFAMQMSQVAQQGAVTGNYLQALSVQAADIGMAFGTAGIAIGMALTVLGPMAMSLLGAEDKAKTLKTAMDNLSDSVGDYRAMAEKATSTDLGEEFGRYANQARELYVVLRDLAQLKAMADLRTAMAAISEASDSGASRMIRLAETVTRTQAAIAQAGSGEFAPDTSELAIMQDRLRNATADLNAEFGMTATEAQGLVQRLNELARAQGPQEAATAAAALNEYFKEIYGSTMNIPPALQELARQAANGNMAALQILSTMDGVAGATWNAAAAASSLAARLGAAAASGAADAKERLAVINAQIAAVNSGQDEIVAGKRAQLDLDRQAYRQAQLAAGVDAGIVATTERALFADRERVIAAEAQFTAAQKARAEAEQAAKRGAKGGAAASAKEERDMLREAQAWYDKTRTSAEKYSETQARLSELLTAGAISQDTYTRAIKLAKDEMDGLDDATKKGTDAVMGLVDGMMSGFKGAKQAVAQLILEIAKIQLYKGLSGLFSGSSAVSWLGGLLTSANGNVIADGQHVKAYANGGIVNGPTVFPMATGAGLMGEAGPEAIMPLSRTADGKLGVKAANSSAAPKSTQVQVIPSPYFDVRVAEVSSYGDAQTARMTQRALPGSIRDMQARGTR